MITTEELLERKAKAEKELVMAQATIAVVDEFLAISMAQDEIPNDEETAEESDSTEENY